MAASDGPATDYEATVRAFYRALNSKDGEKLFALMNDDIDWDHSGLPCSAAKVGWQPLRFLVVCKLSRAYCR
jgi:hypothetical protein